NDGNLTIEGGYRRAHHRRSVALHDHRIRLLLFEDRIDTADHLGHDTVEALTGGHDVHIVIGHDVEHRIDLIEHLAMLPGNHDDVLELGVPLDGLDDRSDLDRFRPRAVDGHDAQCHDVPLNAKRC